MLGFDKHHYDYGGYDRILAAIAHKTSHVARYRGVVESAATLCLFDGSDEKPLHLQVQSIFDTLSDAADSLKEDFLCPEAPCVFEGMRMNQPAYRVPQVCFSSTQPTPKRSIRIIAPADPKFLPPDNGAQFSVAGLLTQLEEEIQSKVGDFPVTVYLLTDRKHKGRQTPNVFDCPTKLLAQLVKDSQPG